jgi:sugar phosphate isomerase/epimerase
MPLALSVTALRSKLAPSRGGGGLALTDVPKFVRDELGLTGLYLSTELLAGADRARLMHVLECADKAACPVLVLGEAVAQPLADPSDARADLAVERCMRVAQAAHWMGCSAFAVPVSAPDNEDAMELVSERLKLVARRSEKLDLNLSIAPTTGLTATSDKVGELLKRIGGFRIGTLPDFATAAKASDPIAYLRRLVPYASMVLASATGFEPAGAGRGGGKVKAKGKLGEVGSAGEGGSGEGLVHTAYDLGAMASVLVAVGFEGPIAIDYKGAGDPVPGILHVKGVLERLFSTGVSDDVLDSIEADLEKDLGDSDDER